LCRAHLKAHRGMPDMQNKLCHLLFVQVNTLTHHLHLQEQPGGYSRHSGGKQDLI